MLELHNEQSAADWDWKSHYARVKQRIAPAPVIRERAPVIARPLTRYEFPIGPRPAVRDVINVATFRPAKWKTIVDEELFRAGDVSFLELVSKRRPGPIVEIRRRICWRLKNETTMSYPQIGRALKRDHTSILHHVHKYQRMIDEGRAQP